jgi:AraC family transcriptional activator of tynA and feaB
MVVEWSTEDVSPEKRYSAWIEAACEIICPIVSERSSREPFHGHVVRHQVGPLDVVEAHCDNHLVRRRAQDIAAAKACNNLFVYQQLKGRAWVDQRNRRHMVEAGDIVLVDPNLPAATGTEHTFDFRLWRLDRARLQPLLAHSASELPMIKLDAGSGETELISSYLDAVLRTHANLSDTSLNLAFDTVYALLANAAGITPELREQGRLGRRAAMLQRVMRQVELRAAEPDLNAEKIAAEFSISLRGLHQLFACSKTTFHEYLMDVRVAKACDLLRDPNRGHLGVADVGLAAGFSEASTFYRRFKARYDATPGEFRSAAAMAIAQSIDRNVAK